MNYNKNMTRDRWTILDIDESLIKEVKRYSKKKGYRINGAVSHLIKEGLKHEK